ncbi:MAG: Drug resistance transporter EmrB/QacA subfamily [Gammaproteobacteria bacterium]|nr:Drug resistance transporter EmrB/QacA subfamily [Gammaproteobacteria bacterium]
MNPPSYPSYPRATLAATILGSSLAFIDGSVVNVGLPALAKDLHATASTLPWTINAYLLPLGALVLLGGGLGDHFGRRRYFLIGLVVFTVGSILCAVAPSLSLLIAGRGVQGIGAALLMPNSLAILGSQYHGEARGRAIGVWAAVGAIAGALGPIVGGWLIDTVGWRVIFLINVPVALAAGILASRFVGEDLEDSPATPLDWAGTVLATAALGLLTWSLTEAAGASLPPTVLWSTTMAGAALLVTFVWHERQLADRALMPLTLFAAPAFVGLTLLTFLLYGTLGGLLVLLPFFLIRIAHWSAVSAGAALLPVPVLIGSGSGMMGRLAARYGGRLPLTVGCALVGIGIALYARIDSTTVSYWTDVFPPTLLVALGMGIVVAPLTTSVMESIDARHVGIASGLNNAVARIAGLVATASLGSIFSRQDSAAEFLEGVRLSAGLGSASALLASLCAFALVRSNSRI